MTNMKLLLAAFVVATASTAEAVNSGKNQYTVTMWGPKEVPGDFGAFGPKGDDTTDVGTCGGTGHDYILSSKSDTVTGDSTGMCSDMTKVGTEEKAQMSLQCGEYMMFGMCSLSLPQEALKAPLRPHVPLFRAPVNPYKLLYA